jgi:hypothetical protein
LKKNEGLLCIVPGTALTRRPALRANRAGAVPSAGTAQKKGCCAVLRRLFRHGGTARHGTKKPPGRLGPDQIGLGPGSPFGILYIAWRHADSCCG